MELHATPVSTAFFWAGARTLTLAFSSAAAGLAQYYGVTPESSDGIVCALVACAMLLGGPGTALVADGSGQGTAGAFGWAACVVAWALHVQIYTRRGEVGHKGSKSDHNADEGSEEACVPSTHTKALH